MGNSDTDSDSEAAFRVDSEQHDFKFKVPIPAGDAGRPGGLVMIMLGFRSFVS
jgi:hypothetical protein